LKNVGEAGKTRQKRPKKRSLRVVNEHFEAVFNAVLPTQVVFQRPAGAPASLWCAAAKFDRIQGRSAAYFWLARTYSAAAARPGISFAA
jgi:hypothetical protein